MHAVGVGLVIALTLVSCEQQRSRLDDVPARPTPTAASAAPSDGRVSGRVLETMDSGGYTYARVERGGSQVWLAGPATPLTVNTELGPMDGTLMTAFRSDTLNRTFDQIYFVNAFAVAGGAPVAAAVPSPAEDLTGTVSETMNAGGYTYAHVTRAAGPPVWVAGPETKLAVGDKLRAMHGTLMTGFHSETLRRTFDEIYFVDQLAGAGGTAAAAPTNPHGAAAADSGPVEAIAPAPGGTTIANVFANKAALAGTQVVVRGKVTKVNNGILGKNWVHLRDGTGAASTNDLLLTTQATAKVGDVVVARGTVAIDKDLGAGYRYGVLVEDATLAAK